MTARRWRELVAAVLTAVLVAGFLLWGVDRLGRTFARSLVTQELQRLTGTPRPPVVELLGDGFLWQTLTGRYDGMEVTLRGLSSGPLRIERLDARLSGLHVPLSDLVLGNPSVLGVESASAEAVLTYPDLDRYLEFTGRPYTVGPGAGSQELEISGEVQVLGRVYDVSADAVLGAEGGALTVSPTSLDTGSAIDRPAEILLRQRLTFLVPLNPLPFGQQVTGVSAEPGGVLIRTEAEGLALRPR